MDDRTAYTAMYEFLVGYYERTKSDDVGALLGGMSLLADGDTVRTQRCGLIGSSVSPKLTRSKSI